MGAACCVAARDRTITNGSSRVVLPRTIRYSPSWSGRRDNRRRVAGEEASIIWFSDDPGTNDRFDNKYQTTAGTAYTSEEGSPLESFQNLAWQKSSPSEGYMVPQSDQSVSQRASEVNSRIPAMKSPSLSISEEGGSSLMRSGWSNESNWGSHAGSSDNGSLPAFNEFMTTSHHHRERSSFDSDSGNLNRGKISNRTSGRVSPSPSIDMQTCGICSMLLTEKSSWGTHKIMPTSDLPVIAILVCGHVYHSECLETVTSEINKYDPACPVCTFGEKSVIKLAEKARKANLELKARINKKSRRRVVDGDDIMFDHHKNSPKMSSSSSMKSSLGMPFLKRHLSFGSKGSRSLSDNNFPRKKGFFWAKSSKQ